MSKMFAYYEKGFNGNWTLCVYHDGPPPKNAQGKDPERHGPFPVPEEMIDNDGSPNMGAIKKVFVEPKGENDV